AHSPASPTSAATAVAPSSAAAASTFSARRETSVSSKPSSRNMRAIASPMPDEPPVTRAARSICVVYQEGNAGRSANIRDEGACKGALLSPEGGGFGRRLRTLYG